jgi:hypothetical protein
MLYRINYTELANKCSLCIRFAVQLKTSTAKLPSEAVFFFELKH